MRTGVTYSLSLSPIRSSPTSGTVCVATSSGSFPMQPTTLQQELLPWATQSRSTSTTGSRTYHKSQQGPSTHTTRDPARWTSSYSEPPQHTRKQQQASNIRQRSSKFFQRRYYHINITLPQSQSRNANALVLCDNSAGGALAYKDPRHQVPEAHPKCPVAQQSPRCQLAETEGARYGDCQTVP